MPPPIPTEQLAAVLGIIFRHADGTSIDTIRRALRPQPPRRSLQRWIASLVRQGRIMPLSAGRGRRYRAAGEVRPTTSEGRDRGPTWPASPATTGFHPIRLSVSAKEIQRRITRPLTQRKPVGYKRSFLEDYRPNVSGYLPPTLRRKQVDLLATNFAISKKYSSQLGR